MDADTAPLTDYLSPAERRAFADLAGTSQPLMQVPPRTLLRLLQQVTDQQQRLLLHERREKSLRQSALAWMDNAGYQDEAQEVLEVLNDPHHGGPANQEQFPELPPSSFADEMGPHPRLAPHQKDDVTPPLTRPQLDALARMPADWFCSGVLSPAIRAAEGICQRLVKKGALEQRSACPDGEDVVRWTQRTPHTRYYEYRKVPAPV